MLDLHCPSNSLLSLKVFRVKILLSVFNHAMNLRCRSKRKITQEVDMGHLRLGLQKGGTETQGQGYVSRIPISQNRV